jgi:hypothetical protein
MVFNLFRKKKAAEKDSAFDIAYTPTDERRRACRVRASTFMVRMHDTDVIHPVIDLSVIGIGFAVPEPLPRVGETMVIDLVRIGKDKQVEPILESIVLQIKHSAPNRIGAAFFGGLTRKQDEVLHKLILDEQKKHATRRSRRKDDAFKAD